LTNVLTITNLGKVSDESGYFLAPKTRSFFCVFFVWVHRRASFDHCRHLPFMSGGSSGSSGGSGGSSS